MQVKMEVKRVLNRFWHLGPCSDIYMFHHVTAQPERLLSLTLETDAFLRFLDRPHTYAPLTQVMEDKRYPGLSAITFDDGLLDAYTVAYPALKERNIPFTLFVSSAFVGEPGYLSRDQLLELAADSLCTIGAHGTRHRVLTQVGEAERREEIFQSKDELQQLLGKEIDIYAYSNGRYDDGVLSMMQEAGYKAACAVAGRPLNKQFDLGPYAYPRLSVEEATREMFRL